MVDNARHPSTAPKLLTVDEARAVLGGLNVRSLVFHDRDAFATRCVVRVGRAVRIREDALAAWINERTGAPAFAMSPAWREKNRIAPAKRQTRKGAA